MKNIPRLKIIIIGRYLKPCFSSPLLTNPNTRDARTSITIIKKTEKYFIKLTDTFIFDNVNGSAIEEGVSGIPENILVSISTKIVESENNAGAKIDTAKKMNITYINTLEAAFFSSISLSLILIEVSSNNIAKSPPALIPEIIKRIIL